ncbi:Disease resistance protein RUN1 [Linum grandiflorum]
MASSSSSQSMMYTGKWEYDVFLCFRGADTRDGFTSHLMDALSKNQIKTFIDHDHNKTDSLLHLLSVLQRSALSVVVFSENFADSVWCLEEVAIVSLNMNKFGHRVLPIFYKVSPSDVKDDFGSYAATIDRQLGASRSVEDRKRWKDALKAVANSAGHTSRETKIDAELIRVIVEDVQKKLTEISPTVRYDNLVGMDTRVSNVEQLLAMNMLDDDDTRIVGLWGMGGVGKTTLAKTCYQRVTSSLINTATKHHIVMNINDSEKTRDGIETIIQELYSTLLSEHGITVDKLDASYRRQRLSRMRVFVVLDDVDTPRQLEQLLLGNVLNLTRLFGSGSRIVITTRNKRVLDHAMAHVYHVEGLDSVESLELFSLHAFREERTQADGLMYLSRLVVSYCKGNPLAIKVLGGALFRKDRSYWESMLFELRKIRNPEIHDVLRRSYDALGDEEKRLFLDVACFLFGASKGKLIKYVAASYGSAYSRVEDLIDKSLLVCIPVNGYDSVQVHDLLKEMAWNIVNEESNLVNRTGIKNPDDVHKLLAVPEERISPSGFGWLDSFFSCFLMKYWLSIFKSGTDHGGQHKAIETLSLNLLRAKEMHLKANAFQGMDSLRYMEFVSGKANLGTPKIFLPSGGLDNLPDGLRWLHWDGFPSKSLPTRFRPENLVVLVLRHCQIRRCWEGVQPELANLISLVLSYCTNLIEVPNLSKCQNLELIRLKGCSSLIEVPSHVQHLEKLIELDVSECRNLSRLPDRFDSTCLKILRMPKCPNLTVCPDINSEVHLDVLDLEDTPFRELPSTIYKVKQGGSLRICGQHITTFPRITKSLKLFRLCHTTMTEIHEKDCSSELFDRLELVGNSQLKTLSQSIWKMVKNKIQIQNNPLIESLPEISANNDELTELYVGTCRNLKSFPSGICNLISLQILRFMRTAITSLPSSIPEMDQLRVLNLSFCESLEFLPNNISKLVKLYILFLKGCSKIQTLPTFPPNLHECELSGCKSLQALPDNTGELLNLSEFTFENCPLLDENLPNQLTADFYNHAAMSMYPKGILVCSGSELPKWCVLNYNNPDEGKDDCYVEVKLLPTTNSGSSSSSMSSDQQMIIKGIAFGAVLSVDVPTVALHLNCDCSDRHSSITTTTTTTVSFPSLAFRIFGGEAEGSSEYVCLWFDKKL